jgi:hypothetical protein
MKPLITVILVGGFFIKSPAQDKPLRSSFGGEVRQQYFRIANENWTDKPETTDAYLLSRYLGHIDLRYQQTLRVLLQLQSSLAGGKREKSVVDHNALDIHQIFASYHTPVSPTLGLTLQTGRQEMSYGSQRLVSLRERPNSRQSFDGVKTVLKHKEFQTDLFYTHPVSNKPGVFNDPVNPDAEFWGSYTMFHQVPLLGTLDIYYFGLWKNSALFENARGEELRHSIGLRLSQDKNAWDYDLEGVYQFGRLVNQKISAWTFSVNIGRKFKYIPFQPRIGLKSDMISGDKRPGDGMLQTFNPLFPKGSYFGLAALIGPVNLFDLHPSAEFHFSKKTSLIIDHDLFWRLSAGDGIYAPNLRVLYPSQNLSDKFVAAQTGINLDHHINDTFFISLETTWSKPGAFLKNSGAGKAVIFGGITFKATF